MIGMDGVLYIERFVNESDKLYDCLIDDIGWDERMKTRKTASFGKAYNYSQIHYPYQKMLPQLEAICNQLKPIVGFEPNNCLINYYFDGKSKMGYHSDQVDILEDNTGIAIVSLGETRTLKYRNILNKDEVVTYNLLSGSLVYMTQEVQDKWQHSIPKSDTENGRLSLTFRAIR